MQALSFSQNPGRTVMVNGETYLFFSGYAYLGMHHVPGFVALMREGIDRYGWLFPSSRISNTRLKLFETCEALLSTLTGAEDTVLVSSGFTAGRMAVALRPESIVNRAPSHPAISAPHGGLSGAITWAVDSIDPIRASITDFSFVTADSTVIVDDSHGIGLLGKKGEGIISLLPAQQRKHLILTYSLSKAFNIIGGAISCSLSLATALRRMPEYAASTAPSPAMLHAFIEGQPLFAAQREKLQDNIRYFRSLISDVRGILFHPLLPVFILPPSFNEQQLLQRKIIISSFAYPNPEGEKIQRIVLNALHTRSDLERLAEGVAAILKDDCL